MPRQPYGDHGGGGDVWVEAGKLAHRALELGAVIPVGYEDDLRVHRDARLGQALHDGQDLAANPRLAEKAVAEVRIGRVDRDVERREALLLDAPELVFVQI